MANTEKLWTEGHALKAQNQGWNLFNADGELQLQREDEMGIFETDHEAWEFVYAQSIQKDNTAIIALARIAAESPKELKKIKEHLKI
jgi:hypothetical protein